MGRDLHSIVADPLFEDPENYDFRFRKRAVARKIGFVPFDYSRAGVIGSEDWKAKATVSPNWMSSSGHCTSVSCA